MQRRATEATQRRATERNAVQRNAMQRSDNILDVVAHGAGKGCNNNSMRSVRYPVTHHTQG